MLARCVLIICVGLMPAVVVAQQTKIARTAAGASAVSDQKTKTGEKTEAGEKTPPDPNGCVRAVTVYPGHALVTRAVEVTVPANEETHDHTISSLPAGLVEGSIAAVVNDDRPQVRVLAIRSERDAEPAARAKKLTPEEVQKNKDEVRRLKNEVEAIEKDLKSLDKLENAPSATRVDADKTRSLDAAGMVAVVKYVIESRAAKTASLSAVQNALRQAQADIDASVTAEDGAHDPKSKATWKVVISIARTGQKGEAVKGKIHVSYLVAGPTWTPRYQLALGPNVSKASSGRLDCLATVDQHTGENWANVDLTLATGRPLDQARWTELRPLRATLSRISGSGDTSTGAGAPNTPLGAAAETASPGTPEPKSIGPTTNEPAAPGATAKPPAVAGSPESRPVTKADSADLNVLAAARQSDELLPPADKAERAHSDSQPMRRDSAVPRPAVPDPANIRLHAAQRTLSGRAKDMLAINSVSIDVSHEYRAVPLLDQNVYHMAELRNRSELTLAPGTAAFFENDAEVGTFDLPLVAPGQSARVCLGIEPKLRVTRRLLEKSHTGQGSSFVQLYVYRIAVESWLADSVRLEIWDRMPAPEPDRTFLDVRLVESTPPAAEHRPLNDPEPEHARNLLRWSLTIPPGSHGESAQTVEYVLRLEHSSELKLDPLDAARGPIDPETLDVTRP